MSWSWNGSEVGAVVAFGVVVPVGVRSCVVEGEDEVGDRIVARNWIPVVGFRIELSIWN